MQLLKIRTVTFQLHSPSPLALESHFVTGIQPDETKTSIFLKYIWKRCHLSYTAQCRFTYSYHLSKTLTVIKRNNFPKHTAKISSSLCSRRKTMYLVFFVASKHSIAGIHWSHHFPHFVSSTIVLFQPDIHFQLGNIYAHIHPHFIKSFNITTSPAAIFI